MHIWCLCYALVPDVGDECDLVGKGRGLGSLSIGDYFLDVILVTMFISQSLLLVLKRANKDTNLVL